MADEDTIPINWQARAAVLKDRLERLSIDRMLARDWLTTIPAQDFAQLPPSVKAAIMAASMQLG